MSVSESGFDEFPRQVTEALEFLRTEFEQVRRLVGWLGVEGVILDLGIERREVAVQCALLPAELIRVVGALGLGIELSQYSAITADNATNATPRHSPSDDPSAG